MTSFPRIHADGPMCSKVASYGGSGYDEPGTGRFVSEDPARDGPNSYVYASDSPTMKVDPPGRSAEYNKLIGNLFALGGASFLLMAIGFLQMPPHLTYLAAATQCATWAVAWLTIAFAFTGGFTSPNIAGFDVIVGLLVSKITSDASGVYLKMLDQLGTNAAYGNQSLARNAVTASYVYSLVLLAAILAINLVDPWLD